MKKKIEIDSFLQFKFVSNPKFSKDGKKIAFQVTEAKLDSNNYIGNIWTYDVADKKCKSVTTDGKAGSYIWLESGKLLYQGKCNDNKTHYFEASEDGSIDEAFALDMEVWSIQELSDGKLLIYGVNDNNNLNAGTRAYEVIEETPFWFNGYGYIHGKRKCLYVYDREKDTCTMITDPWSDVIYFDVRGTKLVYQANPWKNAMLDPFRPGIYLYDFEADENKLILGDGIQANYQISFWKDNEILFSGTKEMPDGEGQCVDFYVLDIACGEYRKICDVGLCIGVNNIGSDARYGGGQSSKLVDGDFWFLTTIGEHTYLNQYTSDGNLVLKTGNFREMSSIDSFDIFGEHIVTCEMPKAKLGELWLDGEQITDFNRDFTDNYDIVEPELHSFMGSAGFEIRGWCMKPTGYKAGNKYPAILHIHGGPACAFGDVYHHEMQMWANAGYFVIYCNPIGSDGRGPEFMDINGKWGTIDYESLMEFTDEMIKLYPDIDTEKMAACGGSYGGFMTNWIIGHTDRFAAAVSQRSISNIVAFEYSSDIGLMCTMTEHRATAETNPEELWNQSPLKYAHNCKTPTLFIQADEDYRCYMTDAIAMFNSLKMHGCDSKMCLFHGENHDLSRTGKPVNRISRMTEIVNWLDKYLKD